GRGPEDGQSQRREVPRPGGRALLPFCTRPPADADRGGGRGGEDRGWAALRRTTSLGDLLFGLTHGRALVAGSPPVLGASAPRHPLRFPRRRQRRTLG